MTKNTGDKQVGEYTNYGLSYHFYRSGTSYESGNKKIFKFVSNKKYNSHEYHSKIRHDSSV